MKTVDDGYGVVVGQHAANNLQLFGKELTVGDESHIVTFLVSVNGA